MREEAGKNATGPVPAWVRYSTNGVLIYFGAAVLFATPIPWVFSLAFIGPTIIIATGASNDPVIVGEIVATSLDTIAAAVDIAPAPAVHQIDLTPLIFPFLWWPRTLNSRKSIKPVEAVLDPLTIGTVAIIVYCGLSWGWFDGISTYFSEIPAAPKTEIPVSTTPNPTPTRPVSVPAGFPSTFEHWLTLVAIVATCVNYFWG